MSAHRPRLISHHGTCRISARRLFIPMMTCVALFCATPWTAQSPRSSSTPLERSPSLIGALWATPTAGDVAMMRAKSAEVEYASRQRIESLLSRLCPGRCELIDLKANVSAPKAVGRVLPGFDTPTASEVSVEEINLKLMIDSTLPRRFRSNLPRMIQYRLTDLSENVKVTPIQLRFPSPQLAPAPPLMPEAPPAPPKATPEPPPVEPIIEPDPEPTPPIEEPPEESLVDLLIPWAPLFVVMAFATLLALIILRQLKRLQEALTSPSEREKEQPAWLRDSDEERKDLERPMPDLEEMARALKSSRNVQNKVLRRWLQDDIQEVSSLVHLLGAEILNDLKRDRALKTALETLSQRVAAQRAPLNSEQAWRIAHALQARLTAAHVLHDERALSVSWEFLHGLTLNALQRLFESLTAAEQSHLIGQLPVDIRGPFLSKITPEQRQGLMLYSAGDRALSRTQSIDFAHRLKRASEELSPLSEEMNAQASLITDMLNALPFRAQLESLIPLQHQRAEVAHAVLRQLALEEVLLMSPVEALTDALIRTPFDVALNVMRGVEDSIAQRLLSATPPQQSMAYREELELGLSVRQADFLNARASFLQNISSALKREGVDLLDLNLRVLERYRA